MDRQEAIKIVRDNWPEGRHQLRDALQTLIPELQESEDEKIRNLLIEGMKYLSEKNLFFADIPKDKVIAWLEKQVEPTDKGEISDGYHTFNELYYYRMLYNAAFFNLLPEEWVHKSKRHHTGEECFGGGWFIVMAQLPTGQISNHYELKDWDLFHVQEKEIADEWDGHSPQEAAKRLHEFLLEKQGEQKPTNKVEPKFKVGDWITSGEITFRILKIENEYYIADDGDKVFIKLIDKQYHLWTIQDAKDGDVLASKNACPFIYKKSDDTVAQFYCCVSIANTFCIGNDIVHCGCKESVKPATKEQRDLLFSKMKEAGYYWDYEKKELKKIEQNPTDRTEPKFKVKYAGNEYNVFEVKDISGVTYYGIEDEPNHIDYVKAESCEMIGGYTIKENGLPYPTKPAVFSEQNPGWSEEDESMLQETLSTIRYALSIPFDKEDDPRFVGSSTISWLKSIKDRVVPQPKQWNKEDERICACLIDAQEKELENVKNDKYGHSEIVSDLKEMYRERIDWLESIKERMKGE